jgi:DNA-binding CsgD family transcriptional regulator
VRDTNLHIQVHQALDRFGTTVLSRREAQVVHLLLLARSSKEIGQELEISHETARIHRRNAYSKLGVSTHAELFRLFIESLSVFAEHPSEDPMLYLDSHERSASTG